MTAREDFEQGLRSPNIFIGNNALRGLDTNAKRFDSINKNPEVSSQNRNTQLPYWKDMSDRQIDFRLTVYNRNMYNPSKKATSRRLSAGHSKMEKKIGRHE